MHVVCTECGIYMSADVVVIHYTCVYVPVGIVAYGKRIDFLKNFRLMFYATSTNSWLRIPYYDQTQPKLGRLKVEKEGVTASLVRV